VYYVYMLRCRDNSLYTGITNDLEGRINKHSEGKAAKYTRARLPVKLVYLESSESKSEALKREYQLKKLSKQKKEQIVHDCGTESTPSSTSFGSVQSVQRDPSD
jgi:putative endonuclease